MLRNLLTVSICFLLLINLACQSADNSNANTRANSPPELSGSPVPLTTNSTPGIPDPNSAVNANKPTTKTTPGIPDMSNSKAVLPKGATPTPGIPDQETLKKQMNTPLKDANIVNNPPKTNRQSNENSVNQPKNVRKF
jgi:hypothetical protein